MSRSRARKNRNRYSSVDWQLRKSIARIRHYFSTDAKAKMLFKIGDTNPNLDHLELALGLDYQLDHRRKFLNAVVMKNNTLRYSKTIYADDHTRQQHLWSASEHPKLDYSLEAELHRSEFQAFKPECIKHRTPSEQKVYVTKIHDQEVHWLNYPLVVGKRPEPISPTLTDI